MNGKRETVLTYRNVFYLYKLAVKYDKKYLLYVILQFMFSVIDPFIFIVFPKLILDEILEKGSYSQVILYVCIMFVMLFITKNGLLVVKQKGEVEGEYLMIQLRKICNRINMTTPYQNLQDPEYLDVRERACQIIWNSTYFNSLAFSFANQMAGIVQTIVICILISVVDWKIIVLSGILFLINTMFQIKNQKKNHVVDQEMAEVRRKWNYLDSLASDFNFAKIIRLEFLNDWLTEKSKSNRDEFYEKQAHMLHNDRKVAVVGTILSSIQELVIYSFLISKVIFSNMQISSFSMYLVAVNQFTTSLNEILTNTKLMYHYALYMEDFKNFINEQSDTKDSSGLCFPQKSNEGCTIEFRDVSFRYPNTENWVLRHINLTIQAGERIMLVGDNGAGKTTLIKLLMRLYEPVEGVILLNGIDVRKYDNAQYQKQIATVFQDYKLFSFKIGENIIMNSWNLVDSERLKLTLDKSELLNVLDKLHAGLDTYMGKKFEEGGIELSGGEKQKLTIARAIYKESSILILDEPTANLSPIAEYNIYKQYNQMAEDKTTMFVSHRLSSSQLCDKVALLQNGTIAEYGSHKELLERRGLYEKMFRLQSQYYDDSKGNQG